MKRGGYNELLQTSVAIFMKKRNYSDTGIVKRSALKTEESGEAKEQICEALMSASLPSALAYSPHHIQTPERVTSQFRSFQDFVKKIDGEVRHECMHIIFPALLHLFCHLVDGNGIPAARDFLSKNEHLLSLSSREKKLIAIAKLSTSSSDLQDNPLFGALCRGRRLSRLGMEYISRFLKASEELALLAWVITSKMQLRIETEDNKGQEESSLSVMIDEKSPTFENEPEPSLASVIEKVNALPSSPPSILLLTIGNAFQGLCCVGLSRDLSMLAGGFEDSSINIWPIKYGKMSNFEKVSLLGHAGSICGVSFLTQDILVSGGHDTNAKLWQPSSSSAPIATFRGHSFPIWTVVCSPLETGFATGSMDHTAKLWSTERVHPLRTFVGHQADINAAQFHMGGQYLATGSSDRTVRLWAVNDGRMVRLLQGHRGAIYTLTFSPNGKYLASAGEDRRIRIWDIGMSTVLREFRGHTDTVFGLCFNDAGDILGSCGLDGTVRLWDVLGSTTSHAGLPGPSVEPGGLVPSPNLLSTYPAPHSSLLTLQFSHKNILYVVGHSDR